MEKIEEKNGKPCEVRKPFRRPSLRVYGNISAITQAIMAMGGFDSGAGSGMRTAA